jgi:hypothetical protein
MIGMEMALGMGALQMFAGKEQAKNQALMQQAQHRIDMSNFARGEMIDRIQNMLKNEEISRVNQARWRQNRAIASAANETRALKEDVLRKNTATQLLNISRGQNQALDSLTSSAVAAGMTPQSGTAKALRRQLETKGYQEMVSLRANDYYARQNIIREQENALRTRDMYSHNEGAYYLPGQPPQLVQQTGTSFLQDATAFMGGAGQAVSMMGNINQAMGPNTNVNWGAGLGDLLGGSADWTTTIN